MTTKRTQFLSRLLRISELNEQLMELADKSAKQPAYAKKIKLIQMNPNNLNMPDPRNLPNNPQKMHGRIMVISKHSNQLNHVSSYRSETILVEEELQKSSISPVRLHEHQAKSLMDRKRTSVNIQPKPIEEELHYSNSVTCEGRYLPRTQDIYKRKYNYKDNSLQKRNNLDRRGEFSSKIINQQSVLCTESPAKSIEVIIDKVEKREIPRLEIRVERQPKYFKSLNHISQFSHQKQIQQEKKAKLSLMKQINKNYAKPFIPPPKITAKSYIICETKDNEDTLRVVVSYNSKNSQEVASLTKIMTCILTIQFCKTNSLDIDAIEVKIGKYESNIGGTSADLQQGQIYTVKQLLYGLMLPSGNDASLALAVWCGKQHILLDRSTSESKERGDLSTTNSLSTERIMKSDCYSRFIKEMNIKAQALKMNKTHYANSHGLINVNNRSTAYDIALLSAYAMKNAIFRQIVSCKAFECTIKYQECLPRLEELREEQEEVQNTEPDENDPEEEEQALQPSLKIDLKGIKAEKISRPATAKVQSSRSVCPIKHSLSKQCLTSAALTAMNVQWSNTHKLLQSKPKEYLGIKTGITSNAGPCLSSCVTIEDRKFIIIVLNCARINLRFKETEILKKWLYKHEGLAKTVKKITNLKLTKSIKSMNNEYEQSDGQELPEDEGQD